MQRCLGAGFGRPRTPRSYEAGFEPSQTTSSMQAYIDHQSNNTFVIFDVDGTLVRSNRVDSRCFADTYEAIYLRPFPTIDWSQYPHVTDTTIFDAVLRQHFQRGAAEEEVRSFQEAFVQTITARRQSHPHEFDQVAGAREIMEYLLAHEGYTIGVATGGWERPARLKLAHFGMPAREIPFSGADGKWTREDIISEAIAQAGRRYGSFRKIVYIGDAIWDVTTTRQMGMDFVGVRWQNDREVLERAGARQVVQNYLDREAFLQAVAEAVPPA